MHLHHRRRIVNTTTVSTKQALLLLLVRLSFFLSHESLGFSYHSTRTSISHRYHHPKTGTILARNFLLKTTAEVSVIRTTTRLSVGNEKTSSDETTTTTTTAAAKNSKNVVARVLEQTMVLDGAEWISVRKRLLLEQPKQNSTTSLLPSFARTPIGVWTAVTGSWNGQRVVAMKVLSENDDTNNNNDTKSSSGSTTLLDQPIIRVYTESIAVIPDKISEETALWTMCSSLSTIHCALPIVANVGGSAHSIQIRDSGKIVILGGNEMAVNIANILAKLNYQVVLVTDKKPAGILSNVEHMTPAVSVSDENAENEDDDDDDVGFATAIGSFDSLVDTLGNEHDESIRQSGVPTLLAERHGCQSYISCQTESQQLIIRHGLLWGPGKTKDHVAQLQKRAFKATAAQFPSPVRFGETVQKLLEKGITFSKPKDVNNNLYIRGWSMKDFWEHTTWPRDVSGIRYGLPSIDTLTSWTDSDDDEEDEDAPMISAPPLRQGTYQPPEPEVLEEDVQAGSSDVIVVDSVFALREKIINAETTCLMFLSAPFCRTCRYLKPLYQRMARETVEKMAADGKPMNFVFVRAEATGQMSKNLGQALGVDSVPSFLLFKKGKKFGKTLSVSRIPSTKLDRAVQILQEDLPWNEALFDKDEETARPRKKLL